MALNQIDDKPVYQHSIFALPLNTTSNQKVLYGCYQRSKGTQ